MEKLSTILKRRRNRPPLYSSPENPKLDTEALSVIKKKVKANKASPKDYETLDYFLSSFGYENFILENLKKYNIHNYEEYILERRKSFELRNRAVNGSALGVILGSISALEKYITNKI
jgi:hypothetical protein